MSDAIFAYKKENGGIFKETGGNVAAIPRQWRGERLG